jgi:hypothetical protein
MEVIAVSASSRRMMIMKAYSELKLPKIINRRQVRRLINVMGKKVPTTFYEKLNLQVISIIVNSVMNSDGEKKILNFFAGLDERQLQYISSASKKSPLFDLTSNPFEI